jgi:hypothetical protein
MKRILIGLFALIMLSASSTELFAQRKKAPVKRGTTVKKTAPIQKQAETEIQPEAQSQPATQNQPPVEEDVSPSLEETMDAIEKIATPVTHTKDRVYTCGKDCKGIAATITAERSILWVGRKSEKKGDKCYLAVFEKSWTIPNIKEAATTPKGEIIGRRSVRYSIISLSDIDPVSIKIEPSKLDEFDPHTPPYIYYNLKLETIGKKSKIRVNNESFEYNTETKEDLKSGLENWSLDFSSVDIPTKEKEEATRIRNALKHAVTVCGGKVLPF